MPSSHNKTRPKKSSGAGESTQSGKQNASLITSRDNRVIITINTKDKRSAETAETSRYQLDHRQQSRLIRSMHYCSMQKLLHSFKVVKFFQMKNLFLHQIEKTF